MIVFLDAKARKIERIGNSTDTTHAYSRYTNGREIDSSFAISIFQPFASKKTIAANQTTTVHVFKIKKFRIKNSSLPYNARGDNL